MGNASALAGLLLLFGTASPASAQQPATVDGAYARLSAGNAKVARALFEAQATTPAPAKTPKTLTIDQIAAMKQGQDWGHVFTAMKAQGLLADKSLGQVVNRYEHRSTGAVSTAAARGSAQPRTAAAEPSASDDRESSK